jgi:hypothetical protein
VLRAENAMQRQKRARTNRWITHVNGLSVQEATELKEARNAFFQAIPGPRSPPAEGAQAPKARALPECSTCNKIGHKMNACPKKNN